MNSDGPKTPAHDNQMPKEEVSTPLSSCNDMAVETPSTPKTPVTPYTSNTDYNPDDETYASYNDENDDDVSNASMDTELAFRLTHNKNAAVTPGPIKTRRQLEITTVNSPSDAMLSPCTAMLMGGGRKKTASGPTAALRKKQMGSIPFTVNDD